jgi:hypothetical protein
MAKKTVAENGTVLLIHDDETGKLELVDHDPGTLMIGFIFFLLLWGLCAWWMFSGGFAASGPIHMPWGTVG